ncbi:alpha-N-acetylneuraminide alpha-2,8-sialyltransferase-like [Amphiura filiformis]|uniref:alpha-N-acetylneuraminide alpha-2,8-sialyltransferase-like n=1 Tax=Amphiura filiformis TaxID=82378 RepID=UPI003B20D630
MCGVSKSATMSSRSKLSVVCTMAIVCCVLLVLHMGIYHTQPEINSYSARGNHLQQGIRNVVLNLMNYRHYHAATDGYIMKSLMEYSLPLTRTEFFDVLLNDTSTASQVTNRTLLLKYREEFNEGSTAVGLPQNMFCTKENTNVDETLGFLFSLGKAKITQHLWNLFPETSIFKDKRRYKKCNIIGNSGILFSSKCGKQIDDADFILRCNLPTLKGFEDDVGIHTDLVTANPSIFRERFDSMATEASKREFRQSLSNYDGVIWVPALSVSDTWSLAVEAVNISASQDIKIVFGHPENYLAVWHLWKALGHKDQITTGFYMTTSLLNICEETHLYGFWPFAETADGTHVPYHYYDSDSPVLQFHDTDNEFEILMRLHQLNLLKLHVGPCS